MKSLQVAKRVGILGGSFDPIHTGHLIIAQDAIERFELSEVIFIPAAIPPHKQHLQQAETQHRMNMLKLAVETDVRFSVSDMELERGGVSYTVDTVRELRDENPGTEIFLIVGSDTLVDFHTWYDTEELFRLCEVATFLRPGEESLEAIAKKVQFPPKIKTRLMNNVIQAHRIEISSTEIRMRVAEGLGIRYLVPSEVEMYIFEHGLYRG